MTIRDTKELEKRLEKLRANNQMLKEKLASLKKEKHDLEKSLRNRSRLFDGAPVGIVLVQKERIIDINKNALDGLGYPPEEILGEKFLDFVDPGVKSDVRNLHRKRLAGKQVPNAYEIDLVAKDGKTIGCDLRLKKIRFNGRGAFLVSLFRHERRKQRERDLVHAKKMEALYTMIGGLNQKFSAGLGALEKNIENLRGEEDPEVSSRIGGLIGVTEAVNEIGRNAHILECLTGRDAQPGDMCSFDLKKVVQDGLAMAEEGIREEASRHGADINFKTYLRSMSPVQGDAHEIRDVVIHLIRNAAEAMPKGGDIYLSTEENAGLAHIFIQDNGGGINASIEDRIFDPFFSTKKSKGVGLGLPLSRAIVQRHGGELEIAGNGNEGTIVTVRLPVGKPDNPSAVKSGKRTIKGSLVLVLEAEDMIRELLSQLLENKGCKVVTASSTGEGLNRLKRRKFDLVIANGAIDGVDGGVLVKKIRKMKRVQNVALIAPGRSSASSKSLSGSGADLIIEKPIDMNRVMKQISRVLVTGVARD